MHENEIEAAYPLSSMQQGMLFHSAYAPRSGVNLQQIIGTLRHELDAAAFQQAWQETARRHDALRTSFRFEGATEPAQEVHRDVTIPFAQHDWRQFTETVREEKLRDYLKADRRQGFVLHEAPLLRVALFYWAEKQYRFVWTFHHAILDGRSFAPVLREVFAWCDAIVRGGKPELPAARPFGDYIRWLQRQDFSPAEGFWRELLQGYTKPVAVELPMPAKPAAGQEEESAHVSEAATERLRHLAEVHDLSLATILQGAWALLLNRYSGEEDMVFGVTRSCRRPALADTEMMAGIFINTVPMRARVTPETTVLSLLKELRRQHEAIRAHEHSPLLDIQRWSEAPAGTPLFESILIIDRMTLDTALKAGGGEWENRDFEVIDQTNFPLTLLAFTERELKLKLEFDRERFERPAMARLLRHLVVLLEGIALKPEEHVSALPLLTEAEQQQLVVEWNRTQTEFPRSATIHELIAAQAGRTPDATAVVYKETQLSYRELNERAERLARRLRGLGVGPEVLVGICVERSLEMMAGLLGILKAGGAYVPLDPAYPAERLAHVIADSQMPVLLTQQALVARLPEHSAKVICLDAADGEQERLQAEGPSARADHLAYVIYTSGSTGKPKGVMLTHRNVVNFFAGMDRVLGTESGTWLAVTSISFDISVLELFWTLSRGLKVVIQSDDEKLEALAGHRNEASNRKIDFSLFYFSGDEGQDPEDKYRLMLEGAKFADEAGFAAVWTPERHFHSFGGLYPNPSVTSAAIAAVTKRIQIRAGSVVLPLHNLIRVAEEWAMVDNLSRGRAGISFASGWHSSDFVFAPEHYANRKRVMFRQIETFQKLWRGEPVDCRGGDGAEVSVRIMPRPVQHTVPIWLTASASPETFRAAGELGMNLLTNLLGQTVKEVGEKIQIYRRAWREKGHGPGEGHVTLMLHTFIGKDLAAVRETVRGPFTDYLKTSVDLIQKASSAWSFAAFQRPGQSTEPNGEPDFKDLSPDDMKALLDHAFERYFETSGLFGTPESCLGMVNQLKAIGVDEIACLIDFGIETEAVLDGLELLKELNDRSNAGGSPRRVRHDLISEIRRHRVTHLQCTPSLARMLASRPEGGAALGGLRELLVGGEALPLDLAGQLLNAARGKLHNMYGPTETTVWSTTQQIVANDGTVSIGRPLANTEIYILDAQRRLLPVGLPGELHIGGEGVARGYFNRPELTAERFIPHPWGQRPGARLYRTGDLARYRADGTIEFLGRIDHQVKLRGHRIELTEIEAALASHPAVKEAVVTARPDERTGDQRLVAYVVPRKSEAVDKEKDGVARWQSVWEETYQGAGAVVKPDFNLAGWKSSYTGEAMPEEEMREWVERTVGQILSFQPERVLEIGCGAGLLLLRLAPSCRDYQGIDFSEQALVYLRQQLDDKARARVTLRRQAADDLSGIEPQSRDTIILNSVAQYFPDIDYLLRVLERAVEKTAPGGRIFIGDARSLPLLRAFHASLELRHCPAEWTRAEFSRRVQQRVNREEELAVDPEFFHALREHLPRVSRVEVRLKPGRFHNEITRFRYDVVVEVDGPRKPAREIARHEWSRKRMTPSEIRQWLSDTRPNAACLARIPNARLHTENRILEWMERSEGPETAGEFRSSLPTTPKGFVDPHAIAEAGREAGYEVRLNWNTADRLGTFDAVFYKAGQVGIPAVTSGNATCKPWREYANVPMQAQSDAALVAQWRAHLRRRLPEVMVPSAFVVLEALPLTPNGKVDRNRLPAPEIAREQVSAAFAAPATPVEEALTVIWREILGADKVGVTDKFFELGGHSLLATQLVSRLREVFQVELPLKELFEAPTIRQLAPRLAAFEPQPGTVSRAAKIINDLERMSPEELERELRRREAGS